jgi:hypothetical protein
MLVKYFKSRVTNFRAGQISNYLPAWQELTSDPEILETVSGQFIEFEIQPIQTSMPVQCQLSNIDSQIVDTELQALLSKGVIIPSQHEPGEFVSPVFIRSKKDGSHRMILNLKSLNRFVKYHHFKMDTIWSAVRMVRPSCYMASIDLKDAYYSVRVHPDHQKYLKFCWKGKLFQYTCFPNGLAFCPRKFTKLMKPIFATLRDHGHLSVGFIDDSYLQGDDYEQCVKNITDTVALIDKVGLVPHPDKSVLYPTQILVFLGFELNSVEMTITLTPEKKSKLKKMCQELLASKSPSIRQVAKVLGLMTASFPGSMFGRLHYRGLDMNKTHALKLAKGNYDHLMTLNAEARDDIEWWSNSIDSAYNVITHGGPEVTLTTDASNTGWGCSLGDMATGGAWTPAESAKHINWLETKAVLLTLMTFSEKLCGKHIKVLTDNTTAMCCINQMGTCHAEDINTLVKQIWDFCILNHIWITVAHIPGRENTVADFESRRDHADLEWALNPEIFSQAIVKFDIKPQIDLFASRLNTKCPAYISFKPDPHALSVNAFHTCWTKVAFYAFPPFCIMQRVLQKIREDEATGVVVVPHWPTQSWWPYLTSMLIDYPLILPRTEKTLMLPSSPSQLHPLHKTMKLLMCHLSGDLLKSRDFRMKLQKSSTNHGAMEQPSSTNPTYGSGNNTVVNGIVILFQPM